MKKLFFSTKVFLTAFLAIALVSCSAEDGSDGATGPQGPAGQNGIDGVDGEDGNANVIDIGWFTPPSYSLTVNFGINYIEHDEPIDEITQEVVENGVVLIYGKLNGYNSSIWPYDQIAQLPITLTYQNGVTMTDVWTAIVSESNLRIRFVNDDNFYSSISTSHSFRCIIIPSSKTSKNSSINFSKMSYEEVIDHFGLEY